ncbi:hypothetical protein B0I37DRAFT_242775 [Chaetomium sp. MPI-CAGE-AT-0009]|nr:hypothetical protein B0I37DRAFT_242775 [Chaetomium sp. MPI-CAGE-AT-0009]
MWLVLVCAVFGMGRVKTLVVSGWAQDSPSFSPLYLGSGVKLTGVGFCMLIMLGTGLVYFPLVKANMGHTHTRRL